ncbi:acyltransferase family protein [Roseomonas eburnea]|uniref:Acyltransferase family protein n=1 Tax=Neoroseomonas eburnea TaxID=1346889 RepID=A0A9X9X7W5_9PROT|nr:acyltransferase family protein [Neoroseomonas eburnea]MBR0679801.1 acyltransferase family protein [Neoroseomonas eburnea]
MAQVLKLSPIASLAPARQAADLAVGARLDWVDAAKGVGILLVVVGHAIGGLMEGGIEPKTGWFRPLLLVLYFFHMPLFFFLSGLFFPHRLGAGGADVARRAMTGIVWPYFLWCSVQILVVYAAADLVNAPGTDLGGAFVGMLFTWPPGQFWFLYVLFVVQVVAALALPVIGATGLLAVSLALCLAKPEGLPLVFSMGLTMLPFFALGGFVGARGWLASPAPLSRAQAAGAIGVAAAVTWPTFGHSVAAVGAARFDDLRTIDIAMLAWSQAAIPAAVTGIAAVVAVAAAMRGRLRAAFAYLGRRSMAIYLLHILALAGTRIVLVKGFGVSDPDILIILVAVGVGAPVIAAELARRYGVARILAL